MNLSDADAYALRRICVGSPIDEAGLSVGTRLFIKSIGGDVPRLITLLGELGLLEKVMKFDPTRPAPQSRDSVYIPALPEYANLTKDAYKQSGGVGQWWRTTVEWCASRSPMTPVHFFEVGVVWLLGLAIARRVAIDKHERIYPHLYYVMVAETSRYAKSTGLNTLYNIISETMPYMLIPAKTTPEAMIEIMAGQEPTNYTKLSDDDRSLIQRGMKFASQRGIIEDEISGMIGTPKRDYMQGFIELIMRLYDAREVESYYTRSQGLMLVKRPALSIMGATTPAAMSRAVTLEDWENGNMARYLVLYREEPLPYNPNYAPVVPPSEIINPLDKLHNHPDFPKLRGDDNQVTLNYAPMKASMTQDALLAYDNYTRALKHDMIPDLDDRLIGNYSRLHVNALKIALSLATMDWSMGLLGDRVRPEITLGHWAIAQRLTEKARESLHRLMPVLSESRDSRTQKDIETILKQHPGGITIREIVRLCGKATKDVRSAIDVLRDSGRVTIQLVGGETGRTTNIYTLTGA